MRLIRHKMLREAAAESPAPASRISVLSVLYQILRGLSKLIQPFGGEVHAVEPLQRPVGEGELHELVVFQQLLA